VALTFAHFYARCVLASARAPGGGDGDNADISGGGGGGDGLTPPPETPPPAAELNQAAAADAGAGATTTGSAPFQAELQLPDKAYKVVPELMAKAESGASYK
jgi:hypothetical protein